MNIKKILFLFVVFIPFASQAQRLIRALDTIDVNQNKIILFEDKTWEYLSTMQMKASADTSTIFRDNWITQQLYAYLGKKKDVDSMKVIKLLEANQNFVLPVYGKIYGGFHRGHQGIDIELKKGDPVKCAFDGRVRYAGFDRSGYGNLIIIRHYNGLETYYSHLSKITVKVNDDLLAGDLIGLGGRTGRAYGTHLHFETRYEDVAFDPMQIIDFENKKLKPGNELMISKDSKVKAIATKTATGATERVAMPKGKVHIIRNGDTLYKVAKMYGTTVKKICASNGLAETTKLSIGKKIKLP